MISSWWTITRAGRDRRFAGPDEAQVALSRNFARVVNSCHAFNNSNSQLTVLNFYMAAANDLRKGMAIKYNGNTAIVLDVQHRTPGNLRAFVQAIIRYISTGKSADVRFGSTDKVELVDISRTTLEFSYKDNTGYHFMDPNTYETITLQDCS